MEDVPKFAGLKPPMASATGDHGNDDLTSEAVRHFAEGGLKGEGLLSVIAALVNDTRNSLAVAERAAQPDAPSSDGRVFHDRPPVRTD
jgi:hypothetical protein